MTVIDWLPRQYRRDSFPAEAFRSFMVYGAYCIRSITYMLSGLSLRNLLRILLVYFGVLAASSATLVTAETNNTSIANHLHTDLAPADYSLFEIVVCSLFASIVGGYFFSLVSRLQRSGTSARQIIIVIGVVMLLIHGMLWLILTILSG